MDFTAPGTDEMAEMHQLNALFLRLIRQAAQAGRAALGFPQPLLAPLLGLDPAGLEQIATVPRCVFRLRLEAGCPEAPGLPDDAWESARRSFALAALYGAWTAARRSSAVARALYGLEVGPVRRLRTLGIADLVGQAATPGIVTCGFDAVPGVWEGLVNTSQQPLPRALILTLIAAGRGVPVRTPPLIATASVQ